MSHSRRQDIQGIRGVCVLAVLLYHAKLGFEFGYLGVDMFMVISGYVVGGVVLREVRETGEFRYKRFLLRRVRRLYPTLLLVVAVTWVVFWFVAPPAILRDLSIQGLLAILGISNLYFADQGGDYFALGDGFQPFLHTWSLAVEEQFYVLLATVVVALLLIQQRFRFRVSSRRLLYATTASIAIVLSLRWVFVSPDLETVMPIRQVIPQDFAVLANPRLDFYSPVHRSWQFLLGIACLFAGPRLNRKAPVIVGWIFLAVIGACMTMSLGEDSVSLSELRRLLVTVLTAVLLLIQPNSSEYGRILSWLGDRSYAIYLWHFPALKVLEVIGETSSGDVAITVAVVLGLSQFTYHKVELPYRRSQTQNSGTNTHDSFANRIEEKRVLYCVVAAVAISFIWIISDPVRSLLGNDAVTVSNEIDTQDFLVSKGCDSSQAGFVSCGAVTRTSVMLLGDSQAWSLAPAFVVASELLDQELAVRARPGCLPIPAEPPIDPSRCEVTFRQQISVELKQASPEVLILVMCARLAGSCPEDVRWATAAVLAKETASELSKALSIRTKVLVIEPLPILLHHPNANESIYLRLRYGRSDRVRIDSNRMAISNRYVDTLVDELRLSGYDATRISMYGSLCSADSCSVMSRNGVDYSFMDMTHLSLDGSLDIVPGVLDVLKSKE